MPKKRTKKKAINAGKRVYNWFVEPTGNVAHSNRVIADRLGDAEVRAMELKDDSGKSRKVWQCSFRELRELWLSRSTLGISFEVFSQENSGPLRYVTFLLRNGFAEKPISSQPLNKIPSMAVTL